MNEHREPTAKANPNQTGDPTAEPSPRLGLAELAEAAGVSIRTVRYYIAEGLLPPPEGAGPRSVYTTGHQDRLRLIGRLKDAFLPLREIRRRLDGLDDAAVRALLTRLGPPNASLPLTRSPDREHSSRASFIPAAEPLPTPPAPPNSAAAYLDRVMAPRPSPHRHGAREPTPPPAPAASSVGYRPLPAEVEQEDGDSKSLGAASPALAPDRWDAATLDPALAVVPTTLEPPESGEPWRRIRLGPDAELLIRDDAYQRRRDRIDWLIGWARKVFE